MPSVAFFDLDGTLVDVNSGRLWLMHEWRRGTMATPEALRYVGWLLAYRWGVVDFEAALTHTLARVRGRNEAELAREFEQWCSEVIEPRICREARAAVLDHASNEHVVAVASTGSQFSVEPIARALGIEHVLCTRLSSTEGKLTGDYERPANYGEGKLALARDFVRRQGSSLAEAYFYSDSWSDLPLLAAVGQPRVVNPDFRLAREARRRGWPIERWRSQLQRASHS